MPRPISEIRKPEIVVAAMEALRRHGLPFPSYDTVATEADMSRQLVRHYFSDPEEMMVMVCDALAAGYKDCLARGVIMAAAPERLTLFLDFYFDFLSDKGLPKPEDDAVYDAMFALAATSARVRSNLAEQYRILDVAIAQEVQISYPSMPQAACEELGYLAVSIMLGHWRMVSTLGFDRHYNLIAREAIDRLIDSYTRSYTER